MRPRAGVLSIILLFPFLLTTDSSRETPRPFGPGGNDTGHPALRSAGADESWWRTVCDRIQQEEYHASVGTHGLQAPNRAQNLRTYFRNEGLEVVPRVSDGGEPWTFTWRTTEWGREGSLRKLPAAASPCSNGPRVTYEHPGFLEWYENRKDGLEQGFTVSAEPSGRGPLRICGRWGGGLRGQRLAREDAVDFLSEHGERVLRYGELRVQDAQGKQVSACFALDGDELALVIDDQGASYPLTIDPLLTSPSWTAESDQALAYFGCSVSTAGDVNGDGFSDVIVGAYKYDDGQYDEGRAYVYQGSPQGLSQTAAWTAESDQAEATSVPPWGRRET